MNTLEQYESLCTFHKMCHKVFESAVVLPEVIDINHLDLGTMVTCAIYSYTRVREAGGH